MPKFSAYMKGGDGSPGAMGASIIDGVVASANDLPVPNQGKVAFLVGISNPKQLWVWNPQKSGTNKWEQHGTTAHSLQQVTASVTTAASGSYPDVNVNFSTSDQKDYIHFNFTIPDHSGRLFLTVNSITTFPKVITNNLITSNMRIVNITFNNYNYIGDEIHWKTETGKLTLGTANTIISGTVNANIELVKF